MFAYNRGNKRHFGSSMKKRKKHKRLSIKQRILKHVTSVTSNGCWVTDFKKKSNDVRPYIAIDKKPQLAARQMYIESYGFINEEMCVFHKCKNQECVNPDHLTLDKRENNARYKKIPDGYKRSKSLFTNLIKIEDE